MKKRTSKIRVVLVMALALMLAFSMSVMPVAANDAGSGSAAAFGSDDTIFSAFAKPKAPKSFKGKALSTTKIKLNWKKVKGAKKYTIYQKKGNKFKKIGTTKKTSFTVKKLKANTKYSFKIAVKTKKGTSKKSKTISVRTQKPNTPPKDEDKDKDPEILSDTLLKDDFAGVLKKVDWKYAEGVAEFLAYEDDYNDTEMGFRLSGSEAENAMAEELADIFTDIGLQDVTLDEIEVDKMQMNRGNSLYVEYEDAGGNTEKVVIDEFAPYTTPGTEQTDGIDWEDGLDIVPINTTPYYGTGGSSIDYIGKDVEGKVAMIVLADASEAGNVWWWPITTVLAEAYAQGAAAAIIVNADYWGSAYARVSGSAIGFGANCGAPYMPAVAISRDSADAILDAIAADNGSGAQVFLNTDTEVDQGGGTAYNVVGKIPGKNKGAQQIVYAAHYDKYFYGFHDDNLAVGLFCAIAKAMVDAGYEPENDIVFVAHAAEEWGQASSHANWAYGSWQQISKARPEWQGKTLSLINFELPGLANSTSEGMRTSREIGDFFAGLRDTGLLEMIDADANTSCYDSKSSNKGISISSTDNMYLTDVVGYQYMGVPSMVNSWASGFNYDYYHTQYDRHDTTNGWYSTQVLSYQVALYSALGMYIDKTPALELDFTSRCSQILDSVGSVDSDLAGTSQVNAYKKAVNELSAAAATNLKSAKDINARYQAEFAKDKPSQAELDKTKAEALKLNKKTLKAFRAVQKDVVGINGGYNASEVLHVSPQSNYNNMKAAIAGLKDASSATVVRDAITDLSSVSFIGFYAVGKFSKRQFVDCSNIGGTRGNDALGNPIPKDNWGYQRMAVSPNNPGPVYDAIQRIKTNAGVDPSIWGITLSGTTSTDPADYAADVEVLEGVLAQYSDSFQSRFARELNGINTAIDLLE